MVKEKPLVLTHEGLFCGPANWVDLGPGVETGIVQRILSAPGPCRDLFWIGGFAGLQGLDKCSAAAEQIICMSNGDEVGRCFRAQGKEAGYSIFFIAWSKPVCKIGEGKSGRSANTVHAVNEKRAFAVLTHEGESLFDLLAGCDGIAKTCIVAVLECEDELGPIGDTQGLAFAGILTGQDSIPPTPMAVGLGKSPYTKDAWSRRRKLSAHFSSFPLGSFHEGKEGSAAIYMEVNFGGISATSLPRLAR